MNALQILNLAGHCVENPALCQPAPPSPLANAAGTAGTALVLLSIAIALTVCFGWGAGEDGTKRMRWALWTSLGCSVVAFALVAVPGATRTFPLSYAVWTIPFIAFAGIRLIKESGNPVLAKRLGMGLGIALGISGLLVVGAAILFFLAMNSWANSK